MKLCIDAGGTSIRLALVNEDHHIIVKKKYSISSFDGGEVGFLAAIDAFLQDVKDIGEPAHIEELIASVSGPVRNGKVQFTNIDWQVSESMVYDNFKTVLSPTATVTLINDFEALAYGLAALEAESTVSVYAREGYGDTRIVCGPGTGLGLAALKEKNGRLVVIPSEGGHQCFPVETSTEREIREYIMEDWVSYEHILSGQGLQLLFSFFCQKTNVQYVTEQSPEEIIGLYKSGNVAAKKALEAFAYSLGAFCGNMVLALGATGGVYLWGGILKSFPPEMLKNNMVRRFQQRGRAAGYLADVPVYKIVSNEVALRGCSIYSAEIKRLQESKSN